MTIFKHELKLGRTSLFVWTAAIAFLMAVCVLIYPEMKNNMDDMNEIFSQMGGLSEAFGLDKINYGEFLGFFCIECGNVLGLGGAFFASIAGISALAKEEQNHTAEFLLTHPVSRAAVYLEKLLSVAVQIIIMNIAIAAVSLLCTFAVGEQPDMKKLLLVLTAYLLLQLNVAAVCFGLSAFISGKSMGIGIGAAIGFYFMNIVANLTEDMKLLKYITPFGYADGAEILNDGINMNYLTAGIIISAIMLIAGILRYVKKDI